MYVLKIEGSQLNSTTTKFQNRFITRANLTKKSETGYRDMEVAFVADSLGLNPRLGLNTSLPNMRVFITAEGDKLSSTMKEFTKSMGVSNSGFEIATSLLSFVTVVLPFDSLGCFFRFAQITRLIMRLRYINTFFGDKLEAFLESMDETFGASDQQNYVINNENGYKGKITDSKVGILFFNQMFMRLPLYFLSWFLSLVSSFFLMRMKSKMEIISW